MNLALTFYESTLVRRSVSEKTQYNATEYHTPFKKALNLAFKPVSNHHRNQITSLCLELEIQLLLECKTVLNITE